MAAILLNRPDQFSGTPVFAGMPQYGGGYRPNGGARWPAMALSLAIPAAMLAALTFLHPAPVLKMKTEELLTFDVITRSPPPPAPPAEKVAPIVPPKANIIAPPPEVRVPPVQQQSVATTETNAPAEPTPVTSAIPAPSANPGPPAPPGPLSIGNLASKLLSGTPPRYPVEARRKRETGTVVLRLVLAADGRISSIALHKSSGVAILDAAALDAVRKWRWSPTLRNGEPVEVTGLVQIPFILKES